MAVNHITILHKMCRALSVHKLKDSLSSALPAAHGSSHTSHRRNDILCPFALSSSLILRPPATISIGVIRDTVMFVVVVVDGREGDDEVVEELTDSQ